MKTIVTGLAAAVLSAGTAGAVTLDYDAAPSAFTSYEEDGFTTSVGPGELRNTFFRSGDSYVMTLAGATTTIEQTGGGLFNAESIELTWFSPEPVSATFLGRRDGTVVALQTFEDITTPASYSFSSEFEGISSLSFSQGFYSDIGFGPAGAFGFDNVEIAPVPLPASGLLLLAGLGGAAALRRARRG